MDHRSPLIAIVDDEESVRRALRRLLVSSGLDVDVFCAGRDFFAALSSRRPDCVVLDLHMPEMSGFEIQSQLRQSGHDIPVVIITGHDTPESKSRVLSAGASAYLCKPVHGSELLRSIMTALDPNEG